MDKIIHGKTTTRPPSRGGCQGKSPSSSSSSAAAAGHNLSPGLSKKKAVPGPASSNYSTPGAPRAGGPKPGAPRTLSTNTSSGKGCTITQSKLDHIQKVITPRPHSRMQYPRPDGVPSLNLGGLRDGDNALKNPLVPDKEKLDPPDTASTVSWGYHDFSPAARTPATNAPFALHHTPSAGRPSNRTQRPDSVPRLQLAGKSKTAWDEPAVPENLPPPSERQQQMFKQYEQDRKAQPAQQGHQGDVQHKKQLKAPYRTDDNVDDNPEEGQSQYYKKMDAEAIAAEKRRQDIEQTVLVDQLSRSALCDPEQNQRCETPASRAGTPYGQPRGKNRSLHESRVRVSGSATEKLLDKRLNFNARVVTRSGHDALRELCGFYFDLDNTMTLYEYRQFGTKSKALPFIQRGRYSHVTGRRKGRPYVIQDISAGHSLTFDTKGQPSISASLKSCSVLVVRITHVDEASKEKLIFSGGRIPYDTQEYHASMDPPLTKQEIADNRLIAQVQDAVKAQLRKRACKTLMGLGRHFRQLDKSGDGVLSKDELRQALDTYRIQLDANLFESLWVMLDQNEDDAIDYSEFHRTFIGEMSERRKTFVRKAFQKVDANKSGTVSMDELKKFFNAQMHPHVIQGLVTASQVMDEFLELFGSRRKELSYGEFEDYYEGLSVTIHNDDDFIAILSGCWSL